MYLRLRGFDDEDARGVSLYVSGLPASVHMVHKMNSIQIHTES
jgi:hypothetical protein